MLLTNKLLQNNNNKTNNKEMTCWECHSIFITSIQLLMLRMRKHNLITINKSVKLHLETFSQSCSGKMKLQQLWYSNSGHCLYHQEMSPRLTEILSSTEPSFKPLSKEWRKRLEKLIVCTIWSSSLGNAPARELMYWPHEPGL